MLTCLLRVHVFFFQAEDGIRDIGVTGVQTCALPISTGASWPSTTSARCGRCSWPERSEESRVGKECRSRWSPYHLKKNNNYFKAPWMPDSTEANPNELNQDDARYGLRCCHLKNIWTAPRPPETELSRQRTTSTTSLDITPLQAAYANLHPDQERDHFMQRPHAVISPFA